MVCVRCHRIRLQSPRFIASCASRLRRTSRSQEKGASLLNQCRRAPTRRHSCAVSHPEWSLSSVTLPAHHVHANATGTALHRTAAKSRAERIYQGQSFLSRVRTVEVVCRVAIFGGIDLGIPPYADLYPRQQQSIIRDDMPHPVATNPLQVRDVGPRRLIYGRNGKSISMSWHVVHGEPLSHQLTNRLDCANTSSQ